MRDFWARFSQQWKTSFLTRESAFTPVVIGVGFAVREILEWATADPGFIDSPLDIAVFVLFVVVWTVLTLWNLALELHQRRGASRGWARCVSRDNVLWQYTPERDGSVESTDVLAERTTLISRLLARCSRNIEDSWIQARDADGSSIAISPDGSGLATLVGRSLQIWSMSPDGGDCTRSAGPIKLAEDLQVQRVLAVARSARDWWCVLAFSGTEDRDGVQLRWAKIREGEKSATWSGLRVLDAEPDDLGKNPYAAVIESGLVYVDARRKRKRLHMVPLSGGETYPGPDIGAQYEPVAVDTAHVAGFWYIAALFRRSSDADVDREPKAQIVLWRGRESNAPIAECKVDPDSTHVSILRERGGSDQLRVFAAAGRKVWAHEFDLPPSGPVTRTLSSTAPGPGTTKREAAR